MLQQSIARSADTAPTFFGGLTPDEITAILAPLERRSFAAGTALLAEGEHSREMYVIERGTADVFVMQPHSGEQRVARVGLGATLGEMSLFTGNPASATVRAVTDLDVVVLAADDFVRTATAYPRIYHNLGAILSQRLARSNRRTLRPGPGRSALLLDHGAPPLLGYALAASLAWHTRATVLLLALDDDPSPELRSLARWQAPRERIESWLAQLPEGAQAGRALLALAPPDGAFASAALEGTVEELCHGFEHVLIQTRAPAPLLDAPVLRLADARTPLATAGNQRPGHTLRAWSTATTGRPNRAGELHVPALGPTDEGALRGGSLPATSAAGRALGWTARGLAGMRVGLALGAGSVKGYAHFGVIAELERAGVPIDVLAGTSIGAVIGAMYALGYGPDEALPLMETMSKRAFRLTLPLRSLLSNAGVRANFRAIGGDTRFEDLDLPFAVVAADINTGQEVVFRRGLLRPAVLASMSIPGVYPATRVGDHTLVDGGVLNPVPSNVAATLGADIVIAVKLATWPVPPPAEIEALESSGPLPSVVQVINRSIEVMQSKITTDTAAAATILIEPSFASLGSLGIRSFSQGRRFVPLGQAAAADAMPRIAGQLPWLRT